MNDLLEEMKDTLKKYGLFLVGDSAYPLSVYMQVPYPNARPGTAKDSFNFWLSNARIHIECTFGEMIMRFGLFWRTLRFDIETSAKIVKAAALLHNFIVDCREDTLDDDLYFRNMSYANTPSVSVLNDKDNDANFPLGLVFK